MLDFPHQVPSSYLNLPTALFAGNIEYIPTRFTNSENKDHQRFGPDTKQTISGFSIPITI